MLMYITINIKCVLTSTFLLGFNDLFYFGNYIHYPCEKNNFNNPLETHDFVSFLLVFPRNFKMSFITPSFYGWISLFGHLFTKFAISLDFWNSKFWVTLLSQYSVLEVKVYHQVRTLTDDSGSFRINTGMEGVKEGRERHKEFTITNYRKNGNTKKHFNSLRAVTWWGTTIHQPKGKLFK